MIRRNRQAFAMIVHSLFGTFFLSFSPSMHVPDPEPGSAASTFSHGKSSRASHGETFT